MRFSNFFQLLSLATLACSISVTTQAQSALAKNKKLIAHHGQYFVPPPPAYVPSFGGSSGVSAYSTSVEADAEQTAPNPYSKYIYVRPGYQAPQSVHNNKYVTYWNRG